MSSPTQPAGRSGQGAKPALAVIGNPSSAGSYAAGQDQAPAALRAAGLLDGLARAGRDVIDLGDLPAQIWQPDRAAPRAQNLTAVIENLAELHRRIHAALGDRHQVLLLGGNCTIALAAVAALCDSTGEQPGLLYIDRHFDCNTPESSTDGSLDWMGLGHALALPRCADGLADAFGPRPLLTAQQLSFLGIEHAAATTWERRQASEQSFRYVSSQALADSPAGSARHALDALPSGPLVIHVDVDVLNFTDAPLAESTGGRNSGPTLDQLAAALSIAAAHPRRQILSIGELNPTRSAGAPDAIPRFADVLSRIA
jgi:arginase